VHAARRTPGPGRREACLDRQILIDAIRSLGHDRNLPGHEFVLPVPVDLAS
jgi:hypothetical protein